MASTSSSSHSARALPAWLGFAVGLLAGFAVSAGLVGFVLGSLHGGFLHGKNLRDYPAPVAPAAPLPPDQPAPVPAPPLADKPVPPVDQKTDHVRGKVNAKITVVEYSDFECPFCKRHHATMQQLLKLYPNDVNWVYRHFPLDFHPSAQKAAEASECAAELGGKEMFWTYADALFAESQISLDMLVPTGVKLGLNERSFKACIDGGKYAAKVAAQQASGMEAGVQGTPGSFILKNAGGETRVIAGAVPVSTFQAAIDQMLGK
jgi:protein-disulfide isomerase